MVRTFGFLGALFSGLAVMAGAFGTHALRESKTAREMEIWSTASTYQLFHGIALLIVAALWHRVACQHRAKFCGWFFVAGTVIFSGSLYAIVLSGQKALGAIAPVGGLSLMIGWGIFAVNCRLAKEPVGQAPDAP